MGLVLGPWLLLGGEIGRSVEILHRFGRVGGIVSLKIVQGLIHFVLLFSVVFGRRTSVDRGSVERRPRCSWRG